MGNNDIKIIKPGRCTETINEYRITCKKCHCIFDIKDTYLLKATNFIKSSSWAELSIRCPCCGDDSRKRVSKDNIIRQTITTYVYTRYGEKSKIYETVIEK